MRIHPVTRRIVHGIGGEGAYLDGAPLAAGGGLNGMPDWLGAEPIWCGVTGKPFAFLRGSQVGDWAGWTSQFGVVTSWGLNLPNAVLLDMAADGTVLVGDDYQSGRGISAYRKLGGEWHVPSARPEMRFPYSQAAILDEHTACWTENVNGRMVLKGFGLPEGPRLPWNVMHPGRLFHVDGAPWVVYLRGEDDRIIAHPWDYVGRGFSVPGFGFGPDACFDGETLTLCWSSGAGEVPGDIHTQPFKLSELQDIPSVEIAAIAPSVPSFTVAGTWLAADDAPGNLAIGSPTNETPSQACVIAGPEDIEAIPEARRAGVLVYLDGDDDDEAARASIRRAIPIATALGLPICAYDDPEREREELIQVECGDVPLVRMPKWYLGIGEEPAAFARRVIASARAYQGRPFLPVIRAYCSLNNLDPARPFDAVPESAVVAALNELVIQGALKIPGFLGPLFFAWDRADGIKHRPLIRKAIDLWMKTPRTATNGRAFAQLFPHEVDTVDPVRLSPDEVASIDRFFAAFPLAQHDGEFRDENEADKWQDENYRYPPAGLIHKLAQYMCFRHGPRWGQKRRSAGANYSAGVIAYRFTGSVEEREVEPGIFKTSMHVFDILESVGTGHPRLNTGVESMVVEDGQEWIRVDPVDHVGDVRPTVGRAKLSGRRVRVSSFDLPALIGNSDQALVARGNRWLQEVVIKYGLVPRMFTYANGSGGTRIWRTAEVGLQQAEKTMQQMMLFGLQGSWVVVCGTGPGNDNWTQEQAWDYLRQFNALAMKYPSTIYEIQGGNELTHGIEAGYFRTRAFWQVADEHIIDKRFPFTYGAGHGGESVSYMAGSFLVHHPDRARTAEQNGLIMAVAAAAGWDIVDDESIGVCEAGQINGRQRVDTPDYFIGQLEAMFAHSLNAVTAHIDAGLSCNPDLIGPVQTRVLELAHEAQQKLGGLPVPGPTTKHPVLDVNMIEGGNNEALSHAGYALIVDQWDALIAEAKAWFKRSEKRDPTPGELRMMTNVRLVAERYRWVTPRAAWTNAWPNGAPQ